MSMPNPSDIKPVDSAYDPYCANPAQDLGGMLSSFKAPVQEK